MGAANDLNLDFLPVAWEQFDVALAVEALGVAQPPSTPTAHAYSERLGVSGARGPVRPEASDRR